MVQSEIGRPTQTQTETKAGLSAEDGLGSEHEYRAEDGPVMRIFERVRPWVLTPSSGRQWLVFLATWGCLIGGVGYLFIWGFPKLVDSVVDPTIAAIQEHLSRSVIGILVLLGCWLLPVAFIPKDPFMWLAAIVFSLPVALLLVETADVLTIVTCWWLGRKFMQNLALKFLNRYRRAKAVLLAVKQAGQFKVVLLLSLGPVPKLITHYIITFPKEVTFWPALAASLLGCLPSNALGVVFGQNIKGLSDLLKGEKVPTSQLVFIIVSLTAAIVIVVGCFLYARRALRLIKAEAAMQQQCERDAMQLQQQDPQALVAEHVDNEQKETMEQPSRTSTSTNIGTAISTEHSSVNLSPIESQSVKVQSHVEPAAPLAPSLVPSDLERAPACLDDGQDTSLISESTADPHELGSGSPIETKLTTEDPSKLVCPDSMRRSPPAPVA